MPGDRAVNCHQAQKRSLNSKPWGPCQSPGSGTAAPLRWLRRALLAALKPQRRFPGTTLDGTAYKMKFRKFIRDSARGPGLPNNSYCWRAVSRIVATNTHTTALGLKSEKAAGWWLLILQQSAGWAFFTLTCAFSKCGRIY